MGGIGGKGAGAVKDRVGGQRERGRIKQISQPLVKSVQADLSKTKYPQNWLQNQSHAGRPNDPGIGNVHSTCCIFDSRITLAQRSISDFIMAANSCGVSVSGV